MSLAATVAEKANLIWAIADKLTGGFRAHQFWQEALGKKREKETCL